MITYAIKEQNDNRDLAVIEKTGHAHTFTLQSIKENRRLCEKNVKELEGMLAFYGAKMKNVEEHHPFVLDMSEQDRFTVHMYQEALSMVKASQKKLDEIQEAIAEDAASEEEVYTQLPELRPQIIPQDQLSSEQAK